MKASDVQKILGLVQDTAADSMDNLAQRFEDAADKLGDEYAHLADFAAGWKKLSKSGRRLFVEQLLKSYALVIAGSLATKAGLSLAGKTQKQIRGVILNVADIIQPTGKKVAKKLKKKGKKATKKAEKRLKKATGS